MAHEGYILYRQFSGPQLGFGDLGMPMSKPTTSHEHRPDDGISGLSRDRRLSPKGAEPGHPLRMHILNLVILKELPGGPLF
jgi:hypothetical protein